MRGARGPAIRRPLSNRYNGPTPEEHGWQLPGSLVGGAKHGPVSLRTGMAARACHWSNLAACHINGYQPSAPGDPCGAVTGPWGLCASYHTACHASPPSATRRRGGPRPPQVMPWVNMGSYVAVTGTQVCLGIARVGEPAPPISPCGQWLLWVLCWIHKLTRPHLNACSF